MAEAPTPFAFLLRGLRVKAGMTQEELAESAGVSPRSVSDLERGLVTTPQKDTVRMLAAALQLSGSALVKFEVAARGHVMPRRIGRGPVATRTLPRDVASFTGRRHELKTLTDAVAGAGGVVSIQAIGGMAGVGKTAFAVHAAYALADRFPGGQVFLPLHGHTPGRQPVSPADAIASLLLTIGVPASQIPTDPQAQAGLWRDRLAGRPLLLVLDDAADSDQVRPLLPGVGESLVLVTSRRRLTALEEARTISLDTLPPGEAAELLVRLAVRPGLSSAEPAVQEITRLCGCLPLAIGMLSRQLYHHPAWTLAGRAAELASAVDRLEQLATENVSVNAAFDLSYEDLTSGQQQLFRRLGLHPGTDIDAYAAAALDGTSLADARRALQALYEHYLLTEPAPGRYRMHDLIREHARVLSGRLDHNDDREQATGRLLDYYQHAAARAEGLLARRARTAPASAFGSPAEVPVLTSRREALAWGQAERTSLLACLDQAAEMGQLARIIALTAGLAGLLRYNGPWDEAITRHGAAVEAARELGDRLSQANALTDLGDVRQLTGEYVGAAQDLQAALVICRDLGDRPGQAGALTILGVVRRLIGDYLGAVRDLQEALVICRDLGDRPGQARALLVLGDERRLAGDYLAAARDLQDGLVICRQIGDRIGEAGAVANLGIVRRLTGDYPSAVRDLEAALGICRDIGHLLGQANVLANLGIVRRLTGDYPAATRDLHAALGIYRDLGDRLGEASTLGSLGEVSLATGDYPAAAQGLQDSLNIHRDLGSLPGQANALTYLSMTRRLTGDYPAAARDLQEALRIFHDLGNRDAEVTALNESGTLSRTTGDLRRARSYHQQALDLARRRGRVLDEAHALAGLGRCSLATGHTAGGEDSLRQALAIY